MRNYKYKAMSNDTREIIYGDYLCKQGKTFLLLSGKDKNWHRVKEFNSLTPYKDKNNHPIYDNDILIAPTRIIYNIKYDEKLQEYILVNKRLNIAMAAFGAPIEDMEVIE